MEVEPETPSGTDGRPKVKLPKVINKKTGRGTTAPFQFSSANWSGDTAAYRGSVRRRGPAFIRAIFSEAHALKSIKAEPASSASAGETGASNPRFSLCKTSPSGCDLSSNLTYFIHFQDFPLFFSCLACDSLFHRPSILTYFTSLLIKPIPSSAGMKHISTCQLIYICFYYFFPLLCGCAFLST